jgi:hypothetical protein
LDRPFFQIDVHVAIELHLQLARAELQHVARELTRSAREEILAGESIPGSGSARTETVVAARITQAEMEIGRRVLADISKLLVKARETGFERDEW